MGKKSKAYQNICLAGIANITDYTFDNHADLMAESADFPKLFSSTITFSKKKFLKGSTQYSKLFFARFVNLSALFQPVTQERGWM